jgi:hypothetical protein
MRFTQKALLFVLPFALLAASGAQAGLSVSAVGALNFSNFSTSPTQTTTTATGTTVGFGALGSLSVFPAFSGEIGLLYVPRKVSTELAGANVATVSSNTLQIPLLVRFTGLPIVSVGAGVYFASTLGNGSVTTPTQKDATYSYSANNRSTSDFGLTASLAANYPLLPMLSLVGDLRYLLGLTNQYSSGAVSQYYRDIQFLAGVSFGL